MALGGSDTPGEVFLSFLIRYGNVKRLGLPGSTPREGNNLDSRLLTNLNQNTVLGTRDGYEADMAPVFLLKHCTALFQRCWAKLAQRHNFTTRPVTAAPRSVLVDIFDIEKLMDDRSESLEKASLLDLYCKSNKRMGQEKRESQQRLQKEEQPGKGPQQAVSIKKQSPGKSKKSKNNGGKVNHSSNSKRRKSK